MIVSRLDDAEKALIEARRIVLPAGRGLLLFAYGSLMWRPGFAFAGARPAKAMGYHRAFCIHSTHYRGSPEQPGLVLGLDRGGACRGVLYEILPEATPAALDYLHAREMITGIYCPRWIPVVTKTGGRQEALAYIVDRGHRQYAGKLAAAEVAARIAEAAGTAGSNLDYFQNTLNHLRSLHIRDNRLEEIAGIVSSTQPPFHQGPGAPDC